MPGTNITQIEAAERSAILKVASYAIDLDLTTGLENFRVKTTVKFAGLKPGATINRLHPIVAARTAALAMSASRVGSLAFGFYVGVLLANIVADYSSAGTDRIRISAVTAVASLLTAIVAVWLERICLLKEPPNDRDSINGTRA